MVGGRTERRGPLLWLAGRSRRFWIVVVALLPGLYVASFGPLVRADLSLPPDAVPSPIVRAIAVYAIPLQLVMGSDCSPGWLKSGIHWYLGLWD